MDRQIVEQHIADYRTNIGRCGYLKVRLRRAEEELEAMKAEMADTRQAALLDGMTHGGGLSDPTAQTAARIADGEWPRRIARAERECEIIARERVKVRAAIDCVDAWLSALPERDEWILRAKVIDGMTWEVVQRRYAERFGVEYSISGLKHIRSEAVLHICRMVA